jgi:hypothetical protein
MFHHRYQRLAHYVEAELGVRFNNSGDHPYYWDEYIQTAALRDLLDTITAVYEFNAGSGHATVWRDRVRRIFAEENLDYVIDDLGVVHPFVDQEFQANRASALAGLEGPRYGNVRDAFERASRELRGEPSNPKEAWRAIFGAVEALFKLMFPAPRLTAAAIEDRLAPRIQQRYASDAVALRAAARMVNSFKEWVESSHNYRHEQGQQEPAQPPLDVAIAAISIGASILRWLAEIDRDQQENS